MGLFDRKEKVTKPQSPPAPKRPSLPSASETDALRLPTTASPQDIRPFSAPPAPGPLVAPPPPWASSPPQGWTGPPPVPAPPGVVPFAYPGQWQAPVVVNHNYYLPPATQPGTFSLESMAELADKVFPSANFASLVENGQPRWPSYATGAGQLFSQSNAMYDQLFHRFNDVMTNIDGERFNGNEGDLFSYPCPMAGGHTMAPVAALPGPSDAQARSFGKTKKDGKEQPKGQTTAIAASMISSNHFSKVELYANSRLPLDLPPLKLYMPTYPLLCLAAQYSERVYEKPKGAERDAHVDNDWRNGTKAMVIKSVPMDHMNTIVFAIRGTTSFMDWSINLNMAPSSPAGFLDDAGNMCHSGFLTVARRMVKPVAARLRQLLEEDPGRASYSLLMTGHSAGGAIASLLYCHMLAKNVESELNLLAGCFRRIHCVTFGTPPISLLPLAKPSDSVRPDLKKYLFLSFINEGDPVARADKGYVRSLLELLATPAPVVRDPAASKPSGSSSPPPQKSKPTSSKPKEKKSKSSLSSSKEPRKHSKRPSLPSGPIWPVPPSTLSCAGRLVILRSGKLHSSTPEPRQQRKTVEQRLDEGVVAQVATDQQLRGVIWGDPVCHVMKLYAGRIETLAVGAVTAQGG